MPLRIDRAEAAARVAVGELLRRDFVAVTGDVALDTVTTIIIEGECGCVPVVGSDGTVLGIVTKGDILRLHRDAGISEAGVYSSLEHGFHAEAVSALTANDVMTKGVYVLPEDARVTHAIGLLACECIGHVPIVNASGSIVGILSRADVVAWMAHEIGYEAPHCNRAAG
jgi:CBS-domain-containing membrane protein